MSRFGCVVGAVAVMVAATMTSPSAQGAPGDVITVPSELAASASLASDPARGVYWLAPGGARLVAVDPAGTVAGEVTWDAEVSDIEALAIYDDRVYAADLGDGQPTSQVRVDRLESISYGSVSPFTRWTLSYPDGTHEAEAMMVSPKGNVWIITKGNPGGLYYVEAPATSGNHQLTREADAPAWVTDGVFVDSSTAVLRTYTTVLSVDMFSYQIIGAQAAPAQDRGESVTTVLSGTDVLLGSVGDPKLVAVERPTVVESLPVAPSTAPGGSDLTPQPSSAEPSEQTSESPSASETTSATESDRPRLGRRKTVAAVLISVVVASAAGVLAYRRP